MAQMRRRLLANLMQEVRRNKSYSGSAALMRTRGTRAMSETASDTEKSGSKVCRNANQTDPRNEMCEEIWLDHFL